MQDDSKNTSKINNDAPEIIKFIREKDYRYIKELGNGSCGRTILLLDDTINENFVCKKYQPYDESHRETLFYNFLREIKLLHLLNHENIVRVFNYYVYKSRFAGYILMEFVNGTDINSYLSLFPEEINNIFEQAIEGFYYLEKAGIFHRDIRPQNIMISNEGVLKIIDFGFGKLFENKTDINKSISLNWWCELPTEFVEDIYNNQTDLYFIGMLFRKIIIENKIESFAYKNDLENMCKSNPKDRSASFAVIKQNILEKQFSEIDFSDEEIEHYRAFADSFSLNIAKITHGTKYVDTSEDLLRKLEEFYRTTMLDKNVQNVPKFLSLVVNGKYFYKENATIDIYVIRNFIELLRKCSKEKRNIIMSNLHSRLDAIERFRDLELDDEIPF